MLSFRFYTMVAIIVLKSFNYMLSSNELLSIDYHIIMLCSNLAKALLFLSNILFYFTRLVYEQRFCSEKNGNYHFTSHIESYDHSISKTNHHFAFQCYNSHKAAILFNSPYWHKLFIFQWN